ncbi:hypothetical protein V6N13_019684 [Hibiscus sabdariffa]|uniref:Uncharacterized protein n=1 Tax=Hibiscus sabdariffa TaxID=183260 RepID=A0ABR2EJW7_9ROSI
MVFPFVLCREKERGNQMELRGPALIDYPTRWVIKPRVTGLPTTRLVQPLPHQVCAVYTRPELEPISHAHLIHQLQL